MNKSISLNAPVLRFPPPVMRERKQEKEVGKAIPPFLFTLWSLFFGSAPPSAGLSLSLSLQPFSVCIRRVCAYPRPLSLFWEPRWFRSDTAQPERTLAQRSAPASRHTEIPCPLFLLPPFPFPPLPLSIPPHPQHTYTYTRIYTSTHITPLCPFYCTHLNIY